MNKHAILTAEEMVCRYKKELKQTRIMRWLTLAVFLFLLWRLAPKMNFTMAVIAVLIFMGAIWYLQAMSANQFVVLQQVLHRNCDAIKYTRIMELLAEEPGKDEKSIRLCLAKGLYFSGRFQEAEEVLQSVYVERPTVQTALLYRNTSFNCNLALKKLDAAWEDRRETEKLLVAAKKKQRELVTQQLAIMDAALALEEERYEEFFALQEKVLTVIAGTLQRVVAQYRMALGELIQGETESAKERLETVAEDGGSLFVAVEARELLESFDSFTEE